MAVKEIFTYGASVLREKAKPVETIDLHIKQLADEMRETMCQASGIGLAAPQIGVSLRVIIVTYGIEDDNPVPKTIINPEIIHHSSDMEICEEGCLSVPEERANVERWKTIRIRGQSCDGEVFEECLEGITARIFQHEHDHLEGVLFVDRVSFFKRDIIKRRLKKRLKQKDLQ
jgi:peptide deformylase